MKAPPSNFLITFSPSFSQTSLGSGIPGGGVQGRIAMAPSSTVTNLSTGEKLVSRNCTCSLAPLLFLCPALHWYTPASSDIAARMKREPSGRAMMPSLSPTPSPPLNQETSEGGEVLQCRVAGEPEGTDRGEGPSLIATLEADVPVTRKKKTTNIVILFLRRCFFSQTLLTLLVK